jgi:hypothetical protein
VTGSNPSSRDPRHSKDRLSQEALPETSPIEPRPVSVPLPKDAEPVAPTQEPFSQFQEIKSPQGFVCSNPTLEEMASLIEVTLFQNQESPFSIPSLERCCDFLMRGGEFPEDLIDALAPEEGTLVLDRVQVLRVGASGISSHHELRISLSEEGICLPMVVIGSHGEEPWIAVSWRDQLANLSSHMSKARWETTVLAADMFHSSGDNVSSPMDISVARDTVALGERVRVAAVPRPLLTEEVLEDPRPSLRPEFIDLCASDGWCDEEGEPVKVLDRAIELHKKLRQVLQRELTPPSYESLALTREELEAAGDSPLSGLAPSEIHIKDCNGLLLLVGPASTGRTLLDDLQSLQHHSLSLDAIELPLSELQAYGIEVFSPSVKEFAALGSRVGIDGLGSVFEPLSQFCMSLEDPDLSDLQDLLIEVGRKGNSCTIELVREYRFWHDSREEGESDAEEGGGEEEEDLLDIEFKESSDDSESEAVVYDGTRVRISNDAGLFPGSGPLLELYSITPEVVDDEESSLEDESSAAEILPEEDEVAEGEYLACGLVHRGEAASGFTEEPLSLSRLKEYLAELGVKELPELVTNIDFEDRGGGRFVMIAPRVKLQI